jgi:hypothetical protein
MAGHPQISVTPDSARFFTREIADRTLASADHLGHLA